MNISDIIQELVKLPESEVNSITDFLEDHKRIQEKYNKIMESIKVSNLQLKELQDDICDHLFSEKTYKSNTGNYDPSSNFYWTEYKCPSCHKQWMKKVVNEH